MDIKFNPKSIKQKLIKHFSVFLWIFIVFIMVAEATVIKESFDIFNDLQRVSDQLQGQNLRVNFEFQEKLEERLRNSLNYKPEPFIYISPFGMTTIKVNEETIVEPPPAEIPQEVEPDPPVEEENIPEEAPAEEPAPVEPAPVE